VGRPVRIETIKSGWTTLRDAVSSSETELAVTARTIDDIPEDHALRIPAGLGSIELCFAASANGLSGTAYVYLARKGGDIKRVATLSIASGTQIAGGDPTRYYIHSINITNKWFKTVLRSDSQGDNGQASIMFDCLGYQVMFVLLSFASGTWYCYYSGC
jgi:hypothetical protein